MPPCFTSFLRARRGLLTDRNAPGRLCHAALSCHTSAWQVVGPHLFPTAAWAASLASAPLGRRPLRCTQGPGDLLWLPEMWWHATANVDSGTLAYGEKPSALAFATVTTNASWRLLRRLAAPFDEAPPPPQQPQPQPQPQPQQQPQQPPQLQQPQQREREQSPPPSPPEWYDLHSRWNAARRGKGLGTSRLRPVQVTLSAMHRRCEAASGDAASGTEAGADTADAAAGRQLLLETTAFAHCLLAQAVELEWPGAGGEELRSVAARWRATAAQLSPRVAARQCADTAEERA